MEPSTGKYVVNYKTLIKVSVGIGFASFVLLHVLMKQTVGEINTHLSETFTLLPKDVG